MVCLYSFKSPCVSSLRELTIHLPHSCQKLRGDGTHFQINLLVLLDQRMALIGYVGRCFGALDTGESIYFTDGDVVFSEKGLATCGNQPG
jgi:hypothetical protein